MAQAAVLSARVSNGTRRLDGRLSIIEDSGQTFSPFVRKWRNWQTRKPQELVAARSWRFKSSLPHHSTRLAFSEARSWQAEILSAGGSNALSERSESKGLVFLADPLHRRRVPFVYILRCADQSLYIGSTGDVDARVAMHNEGRGGSYTCQRRPVTLVLVEMHETVESASHRERQIKRWSRAKKESLISGDATALKRLAISHSSRSFNGS